MVTCSVNVRFDTTPFTTALLKVSIKLTRHNTVRTYDKTLKQGDSAKSTNASSDTNDNNIVAKSSLDNNNYTSSEGSNITSPITFSPTTQTIPSEVVSQSEKSAPDSTLVPPVLQPTVEPLRPNTRSQPRINLAFTDAYKATCAPEEAIPTITHKSSKSALSGKFSKE